MIKNCKKGSLPYAKRLLTLKRIGACCLWMMIVLCMLCSCGYNNQPTDVQTPQNPTVNPVAQPQEKQDSAAAEIEEKEEKTEAYIHTMKVMDYFQSIYGSKTLAGQHTSPDMDEVNAIYDVTGKKPALLEFDFMDCSPSRIEHGAEGIDLEPVINWWRDGGLVSFCWHWNAPTGLIDQEPDRQWYRGFYTEATTFNFAKGIDDPASEEYQLLIRDIDAIAKELKILQEAGVPVIWRPLHEASGGWFWWGSQGPEPYIKLWKLMYERLTEVYQLDNLIWVWDGESADWYPGDDVVDLVGIDFYASKHDYSPEEAEFEDAQAFCHGKKMVAFTETGVLPDPDLMAEAGVSWLWICIWSDELVLADDHKSYSQEYTESWMLKKVYWHTDMITRDELPSFE